MAPCARCGGAIPGNACFCPACGAAQAVAERTVPLGGPSETPTEPTPPRAEGSGRGARSAAGSRPPSATPTSDPVHGAAWAPGALVAGRYRIVAILGRGGMGEVYRADDLTLGQSVALKFLPAALSRDDDRLRRFYQEVRVAREISHPNVCRVYDIAEADGRHFLSMEFIDGEDLSSLLRRIGRLPQEKGVEIARQLCAGLGALHERGLVHRDLKPANVMLDGRGRVRLTDFGLAAIVEDVTAAEVRAGTPAYMAPEQLRGEKVDTKSDLFSLGLVLYELFTGKRAFVADTPAEIAKLHREATPTSPTTLLPDLDPAVERVIARCLEKEPAARPSSAIVVAAALPGGDPLAAALAAGEIPSIEMVAAAGSRGGVRPWVGALCLAAVVAGLVVAATLNRPGRLWAWDPMEKPPAVLADRAREILHDAGHEAPTEDTASGFLDDRDVLHHLVTIDSSAARWETLRDARPPGVQFWYRQSPRQMIPWNPDGSVTFQDPPPDVDGMARLILDTRGRLTRLEVVPPERGGWMTTAGDPSTVAETSSARAAPADSTGERMAGAGSVGPVGTGSRAAPDWGVLFRAAGLDRSAFRPAAPVWTPPRYADVRAAWTGVYPEDSSFAITVEAAAFDGRPVHFAVYGPWSRPQAVPRETTSTAERILGGVLVTAIFGLLLASLLLAVHNVRLGRGDRRGARRLTIFCLVLMLAAWTMLASHAPDPQAEINMFLASIGSLLLVGGMVWCFYLALEPWVRRTWPDRIVGWSRLLTGRLRDPLVGRDILAGGVFFLVTMLLGTARLALLRSQGGPPPRPELGLPVTFLGATGALSATLMSVINAIFFPMFFLLLLLVLRVLVRNHALASVLFVGLAAVLYAFGAPPGLRIASAALGAASGAVTLAVLVRFGLLAFIAGRFFIQLAQWFPLTLDSSAWYAGSSVFAIVVVLATASYGLWIAIAGKPIFRD